MMSALTPFRLNGTPFERGQAQALCAGNQTRDVRETVEERYAAARAVLDSDDARSFLMAQDRFCRAQCIPEMAEFDGVCSGFGIDPAKLFGLFHLSALSGRFETDGCSAFARALPEGGAVLAKNRDLSGPHRNHQAAFIHEDLAAMGGRVACIGTLGAPGVYSSGINAAGLALADTAISAPLHGVGWPRYLLMTRLLHACVTVSEALALIAALRHVGGGSLILADAGGAVAAVELFHEGARIEHSDPAFRTNHFRNEPIEAVAARQSAAAFASTTGRHATLARQLAAGLGVSGLAPVRAALADHGGAGREALCRHGGPDGAHTVSGVIYCTAPAAMHLSKGAPCAGDWQSLDLAWPETSP